MDWEADYMSVETGSDFNDPDSEENIIEEDEIYNRE